jgi:hypothetical protein
MPKIDFDAIGDLEDKEGFVPIAPGKYDVECLDVEIRQTKSGYPMWRVCWEILDGKFKGRTVHDNLVFSANKKALQRIKFICHRIGIDTEGSVDLVPDMILGKTATITVQQDKFIGNNGKEMTFPSIPFNGYEECEVPF